MTVDLLETFLSSTLSPEQICVMLEAGLTAPLNVTALNLFRNPENGQVSEYTPEKIKLALCSPINWKPWSTTSSKYNLNQLATVAILFLERYGYINYGVFHVTAPPLTRALMGQGTGSLENSPGVQLLHKSGSKRQINSSDNRKIKVIIAGAGISGLIAAKQLAYFGAEVIILESRDRVGGRMWTHKGKDFHADLGAMVITGLSANPIAVLARQMNYKLVPLSTECNIYGPDGQLISRSQDESLEHEFNKLLGTAAYACHTKNLDVKLDPSSNKAASLGYVLDMLIKYQEKHYRELKLTHRKLETHLIERRRNLNKMVIIIWHFGDCLRKITESMEQIEECFNKCKLAVQKLRSKYVIENQEKKEPKDGAEEEVECINLSTDDIPMTSEEEFEIRKLQAEHFMVWKEFEPLEAAHTRLKRQLDVLNHNRPNDEYLSALEKTLMNWHFANLEFANAARLEDLSLRHWDQDDLFELVGEHCVVSTGYGSMAEGLARELKNTPSFVSSDSAKTKKTGLDESMEAPITGLCCIEFKASVKRVCYSDKGVHVSALNSVFSQDELTGYEADAFLCTTPLGVLKECANFWEAASQTRASPPKSQKSKAADGQLLKQNVMEFQPPLPREKVESIKKLGFGSLNKVILVFPKIFWDESQNLFGYANEEAKKRGELFLFWSFYHQPVLIALVAGQAALDLEQSSSPSSFPT
ncbi:putative lysine-specific histone demethylase 1 [Cichlidogyrus casuarinus]|uniref:Lysine-specific histone demethylase 1 n=1 Tax=Cichlidogyrus casuarinus TaxID=1844966 RepID=A0ABD2Q751_9PLAT